MRRCLSACLFLLFAAETSAHRLDEYLQAVRIAMATNRVDLALDLTPGVAIAGKLMPQIDRDGDGQISDDERDAYARRVLEDLRLALDQVAVVPRLGKATIPTLSDLREGLGVIHLRATVPLAPLAAGRHTLTLTNSHLPSVSVYQVNALVPKDPAIRVLQQSRDKPQRAYRLEFEVQNPPPQVELLSRARPEARQSSGKSAE